MPERRSALSTVIVAVVLVVVVVAAGIIGYAMQGNERGPSGTTESQTSNSTTVETRTTASQTTVSTQTQSGGLPVLNTFTNGADILGNFTQLKESFGYHCSGACQPDSNGTATVSMSYVGEVQNGSHVYHEFSFTFLGEGWAAINLGAADGSSTIVTELFYINQTDPEHSYSVFSEWAANPHVVGVTRQVNVSSSHPTEDGIILPLSSGSPGGGTGLGIWLATVPGFHGQPTLVNQSTANLNGTELSLKIYRFSQYTQGVNPLSQKEVIVNYTLVATFATFQGTDDTFCLAYIMQFDSSDGSFAETYDFSVVSLESP